MSISLIAAMAKQRVIGANGQMPWHLPADLQHFKRLTLHKPIVMGRLTYESIGGVLPQRRNIVITRQKTLPSECIEIYSSLSQALSELSEEPEVMIIGGQMIFEQAMPLANRMYLTEIDLSVAGDTFFPVWQVDAWRQVSQVHHTKDEKNLYNYSFSDYIRN